MSRALEDVLFGDLNHKAQAVTRAVSVIAAAALLVGVAGIVYRFHAAGQFEGRLWEFFAWKTTWAFLAKGLLGTVASAASVNAAPSGRDTGDPAAMVTLTLSGSAISCRASTRAIWAMPPSVISPIRPTPGFRGLTSTRSPT